MADDEPIALIFEPHLRVAGEVLVGEVDLNFPALMKSKVEEVHVKLRGSISTRITRQSGQNTQDRHQTIELIRVNISLWEHGSDIYPSPGTHILKLPFQFTLPERLLPSCQYNDFHKKARVGYFIEVVGRRPGLRMDKRIAIPFLVMPPDGTGGELRLALQSGWQGQWKVINEAKDIRRGIWGDYSHVKATLTLPDVDRLPVMAPVPFTLTIVTMTKPLKIDDSPSEGSTIFPAPPTKAADIDFYLVRDVNIVAGSWSARSSDVFVCDVGGCGRSAARYNAEVEVMDKVWIPVLGDEKKQKGSWKQEVNVRSQIYLSCPPTFSSQLIYLSYWLRLKVDFSGIGNALKLEFPVTIVSSMFTPGGQGPAWDGPPPEIDLPPDYFHASNWQPDEKDGS